MFERFNGAARAAVIRAVEMAGEAHSPQVDTRHLLAALAEEPGAAARALAAAGADPAELTRRLWRELEFPGMDQAALKSLGIDLEAVSRHADAVFGAGSLRKPGRARRGHVPFGPEAKKALELALRETLRRRGKEIGEASLLLGLLRGNCRARSFLVGEGIDPGELRRLVEDPPAAA